MQADEHCYRLGKLVCNLLSLEFMLRTFLSRALDPDHRTLPKQPDFDDLKVGDRVREDHATNYMTLGQLIDLYNGEVGHDPARTCDRSLVELRDAIAHGRVSSRVESEHLRLLKFSKSRNDFVQVTFSQELNADWFERQNARIIGEIRKIHPHLQ
jgi:hypothetical protein